MRFQPKYTSEANIQAEFYHICKLHGIPCFLQYLSRWNDRKKPGSHFDAIIHSKTEILCIIEFKKRKKSKKQRKIWFKGRQYTKYSKYNLPIYLVTCTDEILPIIRKIRKLL